jgi:hypothetical protein
MTHYLKFPNKNTAMNELSGYINAEGELILGSHAHALDVVGIITRGGEWGDECEVVVPPTTLDGYHINYIGDIPTQWEQYVVNPQHPARVFAAI